MTERLRRIAAIVRADVLIRFRRPSTVVVFLLLSGVAYVWIPDPSTGWALLVIDDGRRALYNSAAIGLATAMLATLFVGLAGFYVISNAIGRDVVSRCGSVIASTTTQSSDYLVGKLVGNIVFLGTFTSGFMASSMVMLLVRNEAGLEPWVFVKQHLLLLPPAIVCVAVLALVFESIPFLSGRLGDVLYFFIWLSCLSVVVSILVSGLDPGPARYFDFAGMGFVFEQMRPAMETQNLSIGGSFDPTKPLFVVRGLTLDRDWMLPRIASLLMPLPLLAVAVLSFHRFDPARVRSGGERGRKGWMMSINAALKPLTRVLFVFDGSASSRPSLFRAAAIDARMTLAAHPVMLLVILGVAIATVANSRSNFMHGVMPIIFGVIGVLIAGVPCQDYQAGTLGLIRSAPLLKAHFVWWKFLAAALIAVGLLAFPIARIAFASPASFAAFGIGIFFIVALATSLGVISSTPKTFIVVFLTFVYLVINDNGASAALDFAGFYGKATLRVTLAYAAIAGGLLAVAQVVYGWRLRRES